jgi:hypothetical protein
MQCYHGPVRRSLLALVALCACREHNPDFMPDAEVSSATASESSGAPTTLDTTSSTTTTATGSETTQQSGESTVTTGDAGSTGATTIGSGSSESGDPGPVYPPCNGGVDDCPDPYTECLVDDDEQSSWCSHWCVHADDCEVPPTGNAVVICWGHDCMLDCSNGETCPDGMACGTVSGNGRCGWPG